MRPLFSIVQNTTDLSDHLNEKLPPLQEGVDDSEVKVDQLLSLLSQKKNDNGDDNEVKVDHISIFFNKHNLLCRNR